ncbi:MAG: polymer-forming cytoskeletal protein [Desulfuromonadales bacterium]|nr:polymer-forming cytoskeletal protein [Desulfuromonadales bacterium]
MFAKKEKEKERVTMRRDSSLEKSDIKAFLGPGSQFEGKMVFNEIVRLDGSYRGEISSQDTLIIGETAEVQAEIEVGTLVLSGRFKGNVRARSKIELRAPAQVDGSLSTPALSVEEGVILNGTVTMGTNAAVETGAKRKPEAEPDKQPLK